MSNIEEQNLTEFLLEVKAKMVNITTSENIEINNINEYVLKNSGKFIRSKIIYLYGSEIGVRSQKLIELASAAELIHLSTLIHDDIIDEEKNIPRSEIIKFDFVLRPLYDLAPGHIHPNTRKTHNKMLADNIYQKMIIKRISLPLAV